MSKIGKGDLITDFELADERGVLRKMSEFLARGPVVLFFYPAALSRGCTAECRRFRDRTEEFRALGAQQLGISTDDIPTQLKFSERNTLGFPLLSDREGVVARQFGVRRQFGPIPVKRWTFVVGSDGRVIEVIKSEVRMSLHADRALQVLQEARASGTLTA